ncbi:CPBP family intramembrane glutamic endopeptidase [Cellvibrio sp. pealriver]|uniref:CPBP family intramembrane glutamic endopeptidase n=1 Tax=Cellvibrio sp. pealriver TaxID=1622269 RepID=UPI00069D0377|nr:CPBP family intramembrane glutamic endopeptidase [Cellvibrio sp. pealriver]
MHNKQNTVGFGLLALSQFSLVGLAVFLLWLLEIQLPTSAISSAQAIAVGTLLALLTLAVFGVIYRIGGWFAQSLLNDIRRVSVIFNGRSWWHLALVAVFAGVGEELLFRGVLQLWLNQYCSITVAILIVSIVFGLLHYLSHAYFICTVLMSIAFGVGYYFTDSMLMVMVWHGVYDFMALLILVKFPHVIGLYSSPDPDA